MNLYKLSPDAYVFMGTMDQFKAAVAAQGADVRREPPPGTTPGGSLFDPYALDVLSLDSGVVVIGTPRGIRAAMNKVWGLIPQGESGRCKP